MNIEPLKNKKQQIQNIQTKKTKNQEYQQGFEQAINESFNLFAQYIDQYKRYKNNLQLLMKEQKTLWKQWVSYYEAQNNVDKNEYLNVYNNWLFDYLFTDINNTTSSFLFE